MARTQGLRTPPIHALKIPRRPFERRSRKGLLGLFGAGAALCGGLVAWIYTSQFRQVSADLPQHFPGPTPVGEIERRSYPAWRGARYHVVGNYERAGERAFQPLYRHLKRHAMSMTAPVLVDYDAPASNVGEADVYFLYAHPGLGQTGPDADQVQVMDMPAMEMLSVGVRGDYSLESLHTALKKLENWLGQHPEYTAIGPARRLFYNGPERLPALRHSDVQIPISRT